MSPFTHLYTVIKKNSKVQEWLGILMIPALFYSTAITTFCLGAYLILAIPHFSKVKKWPKSLVAWPLIWLLVLFSGWNNQDSDLWQSNLFLKSPFLFMPFAFAALPKLSRRYIYDLHLWLLVVISITSIPILINYIVNYSAIMQGLSQGQAIYMPIHHVLYSMIMSYAIISNIYILLARKNINKAFRNVITAAVIVLIVIQHILAVRTGIVVLYLSFFILILLLGKKSKDIIISFVMISLIGIASIKLIPSLKQRISYMQYDLEKFQKGEGRNYADSERIYSLQSGIQIWKSSPLLGVGYGDILDEMNMTGINKYPHSQFIFTLTGAGIIGLILLLAGLLIPYFNYKGELKGLLSLLYLNLFVCMTIDFVIEHSVIVAFLNLFGLSMICSENMTDNLSES
ncbi:MAG: O-antigen ligase [Saprospiraceae bacterium]|jgi:O-antigen ligase